MSHLFGGAKALCKFGRGHHEQQFFEIILNWDQWFKEMFKDFSYLELLRPLCSAEQNHLCNEGTMKYNSVKLF